MSTNPIQSVKRLSIHMSTHMSIQMSIHRPRLVQSTAQDASMGAYPLSLGPNLLSLGAYPLSLGAYPLLGTYLLSLGAYPLLGAYPCFPGPTLVRSMAQRFHARTISRRCQRCSTPDRTVKSVDRYP